jgi:CubicO group peptidase (beta-lactamase class C family)
MKHFDHGGGLFLTIGDGGVWMRFIASDGTETEFDVLTLARTMDSRTGRTLVQWCRDRLEHLRSPDLDADELEKVEARMDEIVAKLGPRDTLM